VKIEFIASLGVIAADPPKSRELYVDALGLPLEASEGDDYFHSERVGGSKHFGVWPLTQAARACFGGPDWPASRPVPQVSIEFEVADATRCKPQPRSCRRRALSCCTVRGRSRGVRRWLGCSRSRDASSASRMRRGCTTGADRGRSVLITIVNACLRDGRAGSPTAVLRRHR